MPRILVFILLFFLGSQSSAQTVYKTPSGKKYHLASCHMVKNVSEAITLEHASELGLEPCKICRPPLLAPSGSTKPAGESNTVQCRGLTKDGTRCQHMTRIANGYCYQHQPKNER